MHAYTDFQFVFTGSKAQKQILVEMLEETFGEDEIEKEGKFYMIEESYDLVFAEDIADFAIQMARNAPKAGFVITGTIDSSESAGEYMDFRFCYENGKLTEELSDWYLEVEAEEDSSYEEFRQIYPCTEEEYNRLPKAPLYYLAGQEEHFVTKVPLSEPKEIEIPQGEFCAHCGAGPLTDEQLEKFEFLETYYCSQECIDAELDEWG